MKIKTLEAVCHYFRGSSKTCSSFSEGIARSLRRGEPNHRSAAQAIEVAHHPELKNVLQEHRNVTKQQIARLNRIFEVLNEKPTGESCQGMKGLLKEDKEFASANGDPGTADVGIMNALHLRHAAVS